ncbi:unnamed protein product [Bursaphelenchus okinawaensis]|uniref:Saposin B-type domain-containing protein n=1 Tax=Bursaphelenchus okinawaensis TaxID=465554 RepID=A0A811JQN5_9BILA|nr:unnamed protein product [Bursaphelenchus okinawaensis]CAG9078426.1 unnamed protein product [Bursaphelenchus okinawaensis]
MTKLWIVVLIVLAVSVDCGSVVPSPVEILRKPGVTASAVCKICVAGVTKLNQLMFEAKKRDLKIADMDTTTLKSWLAECLENNNDKSKCDMLRDGVKAAEDAETHDNLIDHNIMCKTSCHPPTRS